MILSPVSWLKSHRPDWERKVGRMPQDAPRDIHTHGSVWAHRCAGKAIQLTVLGTILRSDLNTDLSFAKIPLPKPGTALHTLWLS